MTSRSELMRNCSQCGFPVYAGVLMVHEGVCATCCEDNQDALDRHNTEYNDWRQRTPKEREARIRWEIR